MKRLIVNSDDYGRTPDISRGIRDAYLHGVVTSTTCMMNIPTTVADIAVAMKATPGLGLGVHLVLTMGDPVSRPETVPSLVDERGSFLKYDPFLQHLAELNLAEVRREWTAQIEVFMKAAGRKPTHLDSHHHSSYFSADLFRLMLELAREHDCPIRFPFTEISRELEETSRSVPGLIQEFHPRRPDVFFVDFYDEGVTTKNLMQILTKVGEGTSELMCHPGYVDEAFSRESSYNRQRERELQILTDPAVREAIRANGIELISFAEL
jgi:chitin disaccharide deacetylase